MKPASLNTQLLLSAIGLVLLTAVAVGLPAILLVRDQFEQQAWALAEQGESTALALLAAQNQDLQNLAALTAQRPTLHNLLRRAVQGELSSIEITPYLSVLAGGAELDGLWICSPNAAVFSADPAQPDLCAAPLAARTLALETPAGQQAWLLAEAEVLEIGGWRVRAGRQLDRQMLLELQQQTGLKLALYAGATPLAHDFAEPGPPALSAAGETLNFNLGGAPYYARLLPLEANTGLTLLSAASAAGLQSAQRQLTLAISLGMFAAAAAGSLLAVWRGRALSRPLDQLRAAAETLRSGDLFTPIRSHSRLAEVNQVAYALEEARAALQHTLLQLKQEKAWNDQLLQSIVEGIITLDRAQKISFFSPGAARITGYSPQQALGKRLDELFHPGEGSEPFSARLPAPGARQKIEVTLPHNRKLILSITRGDTSAAGAGGTAGVLVLRDVSDEEAMRRLLGDFLANITHEFRTPLAALAASAELMLDQLPDLSQSELQELLNALRLGIFSLQTLIDNLLEGASIETGSFRVSPRPCDPRPMLEQAAATIQPLCDKYRLRLALDLPEKLPWALADERRTQQALINLLSNAVKWSPEGGLITLSARPALNTLRLAVSDQGSGIPPELRRDLFQRFAHLRGPNQRAEYGAGIGLSVVKAIIEAQGGQVGVEDSPGGGATFVFTLLLQPISEAV